MVTVQIPDEIDIELQKFVRRTGQSKDVFVREALIAHLEDLEDAAIASERLKDIGDRTSLAEIGREFGLAD